MKILQIISVTSCIAIFIGCQNRIVSTSDNREIPKLLMRPHLIGPEEEMGYMIDTYNKLVEKLNANPGDVESRLSIAELFMQEARISGEHGYYYPAALRLLDKILEVKQHEALKYRALLDKASVQLSLHKFKEAKETGENALAINAMSADAYGVMVDVFVELGQYANAVVMADKMVSIRPDLRSYSRVSYLREIHGQVDGAIEAMKLAVAAGYPGMEQTEWARLTLGHLYERYGSLDSAMMQYEMALSVRPNYPFAIAALANLYESLGHAEKADSLNSVASNLIPEVGFFMHRAEWEKQRGNTTKVTRLANEILNMIADDERSGHMMSLELANVHLNLLDDPDAALKEALEEYKVRPDNIDVNRLLAEIYFHKGDLAKTKEHIHKAASTGSKDPILKCLHGLLLTKSDQMEEGEDLLKQVFAEVPYLDCSFCKEAKSVRI